MTRPPIERQRFGFWFCAGAICLVPAALSFFSDAMAWNLSDHASFALLIMSGAALWRLVRPALGNRRQRFFAAVAVVGTVALIWVNLAVGLIGQALFDGDGHCTATQRVIMVSLNEETHRSIWMGCAADLEKKVKAIKARSCSDADRKANQLWEKMRAACGKKHEAFDAAEQKRLMSHPFVQLVYRRATQTHGAKVR